MHVDLEMRQFGLSRCRLGWTLFLANGAYPLIGWRGVRLVENLEEFAVP